MNKKLIALAVAAGLCAPGLASADVKVYGLAHASIDSLDDGTDSNLNVSDNASRLGFKGSEDLGGGLKANFKYELAVDLDDGGHGGGRNHYVGLSGGFGELRVGFHDTPLKDVRSKHDLFGDRIGDLRNFTRPANAAGTGAGWDERFSNAIYYISPKLGGVATVSAMYSTNTGVTATGSTGNDTDALSIGVTFNAGPVRVMLAHAETNSSATEDQSAFRAGLQGKFGPADVRFVYHSASDQGAGTGGDRDVMSLGAAFKMGANTFKLQYAMADDFGSTANSGADLIAVGVDHALSKSTTVYVAYATVDNDSAASFSASGGGGHEDNVGVSAAGQDPSGISLGLVHKF